ncbi:unnamed protein product [Ilex paraguariensis]|uniref:Uncharacterized protein n=1 Tax=Ilex paraguariensis TaxID=185542 RepID=A0ABC8RTH9_9AQUA
MCCFIVANLVVSDQLMMWAGGVVGANQLTWALWFVPFGAGNVPKFPRIKVWNPYKRLGISPDASEEEVWSSRNFLLDQYAGHERSAESIEAAFEKILMVSFRNRKRTKINLKSRLKKKVEESPPWVKNLLNFVEVPPAVIILRRLFLFSFMACWSVMNSAEAGPAFQVALSLLACIYFLNDKTKSLGRAFVIGFGALVGGWICGSFLVPLVPSVLFQPTWTLELVTSLSTATQRIDNEDDNKDDEVDNGQLPPLSLHVAKNSDLARLAVEAQLHLVVAPRRAVGVRHGRAGFGGCPDGGVLELEATVTGRLTAARLKKPKAMIVLEL